MKKADSITISPPRIEIISFRIKGTSPLMQCRFPEKALAKMREKQAAGSVARKGAKREPRDFQGDFQQAMHRSEEGWIGVPAAAFRNACIDVCRMVGFKMTHAKMSIFFQKDGRDKSDGQDLIRLDAGEPEYTEMPTRNATGVADIRVRPMWRDWAMELRAEYDADQFTATDMANLLSRAGLQVGIQEGRPFSKSSNGLGFGRFTVTQINGEPVQKA